MKKTLRIYMLFSSVLVTVVLSVSAWFVFTVDIPANSYHSAHYQSALAKFPAQPASEQALSNFSEVYGDLTAPTLSESVNNLYADSLYFNDTFNEFENRTEVHDYLLHTAENLSRSKVLIDDIARSGNEIYVRWTMTISTEVKGKAIESESTGITHLRFNSDGQVVVHQDYWDGVDGFYQHLPYVGAAVKLIREQL